MNKKLALMLAATAISLLTSFSSVAHEGEEHEPASKPADVRISPRFEVISEQVEMVGVLADKNLVIYLDRAEDNSPIEDAKIEIEGSGFKGIATAFGDGVYQLPVKSIQPGKYPLTITLEAGEISDLLSADLEVTAVEQDIAPINKTFSNWWLYTGIAFLIAIGAFITMRRARQPKQRIS